MRNIINILLSAVVLMPLVSCNEDTIDVFGGERYIYFSSVGGSRELNYTFRLSQGADETVVKLPVTYSGRLYNEPMSYLVQADVEKTDADVSEYALPEPMVFKGGVYNDTLLVTLKKSDRLAEKAVRLSLKLVSNESFVAAVRDSLSMDIYFSDMLTRPSWWDDEVTNAYLGEYSDKKYQLFSEHAYAGDYGALSESEKLHYARVFKHWLSEQNPPIYEDDGRLMEVPVVG